MFDIIPNLLTGLISTLFPIFASYKALRTSDPAQLTPWLQYFVTVSLIDLAEYWLYPIISWTPFYAWIRLGLALYLVSPGSQGATFLYTTYIYPFLYEHETQIEKAISEGHEKAKAVGLQYLKRAVELVRTKVLGLPPRRPTPPPSRQVSYAQQLLSRFNLPSAAAPGYGGAAGSGGDFYNMLTNALQQAVSVGTGTGDTARAAEDLSASGNLVPPSMSSPEDRMGYITAQRERLRVLLQAFDKEAYNMGNEEVQKGRVHHLAQNRDENMMRSRGSEADFEKVNWDEPDAREVPLPMSPGEEGAKQNWISSWIWGNEKEKEKEH
ncbi:MAG: hypothetical protein M1820_005584 [Bogoriella megaspora]|nr:MAG: hypothetical protein M1820_005584 [Bogoriella megaspora]